MTIRRPQVAQRIEHQTERIYLSPGILFDVRAINLETVTIARIHLDRAPVAGGERRIVVIAVVRVEPAIETAAEGAGQPVRVLFKTEPAKNDFLLIGTAVAVRVL